MGFCYRFYIILFLKTNLLKFKWLIYMKFMSVTLREFIQILKKRILWSFKSFYLKFQVKLENF